MGNGSMTAVYSPTIERFHQSADGIEQCGRCLIPERQQRFQAPTWRLLNGCFSEDALPSWSCLAHERHDRSRATCHPLVRPMSCLRCTYSRGWCHLVMSVMSFYALVSVCTTSLFLLSPKAPCMPCFTNASHVTNGLMTVVNWGFTDVIIEMGLKYVPWFHII